MRYHTTEDDYEYRIKNVLKALHEDFKDAIEDSGLSFADWLWANPGELGKAIHDDIATYSGEEYFEEAKND